MFAAVRERFDIPRDENLRLRDFPTLAHVIGFARDRAPATEPDAAEPDAAEPDAAEPDAADSRRQSRPPQQSSPR